MKQVSFRDLKRIPELSVFTEFQMLQPSMDCVLLPWIKMFGIDTDYEVEYIPNVHRDLFNKVALGFRAVGEISCNRLDINGPFMDMTDRLVAVAYQDKSLLEELAELSGKVLDYRGDGEMLIDEDNPNLVFPYELREPNYEDMVEMIARLTGVRDRIRKSVTNKDN